MLKNYELTIGEDRFDILTDGRKAIIIRNRDPRDFIELPLEELDELMIKGNG